MIRRLCILDKTCGPANLGVNLLRNANHVWRRLIRNAAFGCEFNPPAADAEIESAERSLNVVLPAALSAFLRETDGASAEYDEGLLWPVGRILRVNLEFRSSEDFAALYMPFDPLLFFAGEESGDQYAFAITGGEIKRTDVFIWEHETDSRRWVAPSLEKYVEWRLDGKIG